MAFYDRVVGKNDSELVDEPIFTVARSAAGFALIALLAAFFLTPDFSGSSSQVAGIDRTVTGSIGKAPSVRRYTIRRSVMQKNPSSPCYIFQDGSREGDC